VTIDSKTCYKLVGNDYRTEKVVRNEAEESCLQYNAHLISIHDFKTNQIILNFTKAGTVSNQFIWLGLNSLDKRGTYKWSDGSTVNYLNFQIKSENATTVKPLIANQLERCVAFDVEHGFWVYHRCGQENRYYCQKSDFPIVTTKAPSGLSQNFEETIKKFSNFSNL
jgi:hypothetical protein